MDGSAPPIQVAALLAMMRVRGETPEEVAAFARVMRARAVRVDAPDDAVDLCGTGADGLHTFNISTLVGVRGGRRRRARREARQPRDHVALRLGRPHRGARHSRSIPARRRWRARSGRSASASCSRPPTTRP